MHFSSVRGFCANIWKKRRKKRERGRTVITLEDRLLERDVGGDAERQSPLPPSLPQIDKHTHTHTRE